MYIGVDCGTQGTKVVVLDPVSQSVIAEGYAPHELISTGAGCREQEPRWWLEAFKSAYLQALASDCFAPQEIRAIGVSGQQHGLVVLDGDGEVIRPAKLWCDTETAQENEELLAALGGEQGSLETIGLVLATGYTASKLVWLKQHEPENYQRIAHILLPHSYLNYWLTGECMAEFGDASGTGFMDIRSRTWSGSVLNLIDDSGHLHRALPKLIDAQQSVGVVRKELAAEFGWSEEVIVSSGGGDNMMGAIGTGNIRDGVVTISLGTSGTLYAYSATQPELNHSSVAPFCSSNNGWLPLICTMNLTGVVNQFRELFCMDLLQMNQAVAEASIGADGLTLLPFLSGERVPDLPDATGRLLGINMQNLNAGNMLRAAMEGVTFGLRYGLDLLHDAGIETTELRLIGGGANSALWRQMVADVMNTPVICPKVSEAAALGAGIQAHWCESGYLGAPRELEELCERYVTMDRASALEPILKNVAAYETAYQRYRDALMEQFSIT